MHYDFNENRFVMDIPECCPICGADLEVDTRLEESIKTMLVCSNDKCDYELDATKEFEEFENAILEDPIEELYDEAVDEAHGIADGDDYYRYVEEE